MAGEVAMTAAGRTLTLVVLLTDDYKRRGGPVSRPLDTCPFVDRNGISFAVLI